MASGKSAQQREDTLDLWLKGVTPTLPTSLWVALLTTPTNKDDSTGVEVSGGSYARQEILVDPASWDDSTGARTNAAAIVFPQATANWGTIVGFALYDDETAGNLSYWGLLTRTVIISLGDHREFPIGALIITES